MTPDLLYDQMIGSGCARKLVFSWGGNPGVGSLHRLRDAVERGWPRPLEIEEHSHSAMAHAYAAGAAGMPCAIFSGYLGSDLARVNPNIKFITCPVHRRDRSPRCRRCGRTSPSCTRRRPTAPATCSSRASSACRRKRCSPPRRSIVTVEEIVDRFEGDRHERGHPPVVDGGRGRARAGRRAAVVRARLLRARQRVLRRVGRDRARPRHVSRLDRPARDGPDVMSAPRLARRPVDLAQGRPRTPPPR